MSEKLIFEKNGVEFMKLCLEVTVYWTGSVFTNPKGIDEFYRTAIEVIGDQIRYYQTADMSRYRRIQEDTLQILPQWLATPDPTRDVLTLSLESSTKADLPSDMALHFWAMEFLGTPAGMIRLVLPTTFIKDSPTKLLDLAKRLVGGMTFHSGYGGYSINWDHQGKQAFPARMEMSVLSRRYPGIDLPAVPTTLMAISQGIKRVNWLTFLGNLLVKEEKELDVLSKDLKGTNVSVDRLPNGLMIVAGNEPVKGDVNRQEDLQPYHRVGTILSKLRSKDFKAFIFNQNRFPDLEITERWLGYFDSQQS